MNKKLERRIKQIISRLRPATGLKGKFKPPQALRERMAYYHTPGVSIAVIDDFEIQWAQGFGRRDVRSTGRVTTDTLFQAASISKPIFSLAVMRLVQEGQLDLDEDIHCYLSSGRVPANDGWQPRITLRQLLSHTAGLTVHGFPGYQASEKLPTVKQVLNGEGPANTDKVEVNILPGTQFRYSGGGITLGQQALMDFLKKPFPQIMDELVLQPLGLTNSTYQQPLPNRRVKSAATAHPWKGIPLKGRFHTYPEMAAAGLWTTATDLAKVGVELLQVLHAKKGHTVLAKETIESMLRPQLDHQKIGEGEFVGLGFFCDGKADAFHFGHSGWNEGFLSLMRFYKNLGKGAVVMLNSNEGFPLIDEIMRALEEAYDWPVAVPKEKTAVHLANLPEYAGLYATKSGTRFRVSLTGDALTLQYGQQPPLPIFPSSEVEFFTPALNVDLRFDKDDKAGLVALTVSQEGNQIRAEKQATS